MSRPDGSVLYDQGRGSAPRRLLLALVLGLLAMLILMVTANAYVTVRIDDTLEDFDRGTFTYTGLLDLPGIDSVQLLPIGLTGDWSTSVHGLPESLTNLAAIGNGSVLYAVGGIDTDLHARAEVYSTMVSGPDGESGPWQTASVLPQERAAPSTSIYRLDDSTSMLYVIGGGYFDENFFLYASDTVYRAEVDNNTGHIGTWLTDTWRLPTAAYYAAAVVHDGALYVIGGFGGIANGVPFSEVYYATLNSDGSLNEFQETEGLPQPLFNGYAVVYDAEGEDGTDTVYYIGGRDNITSTFEVYFADFEPGGGLTAWQPSSGTLPVHLYGHGGAVMNKGDISHIVVAGGVADALELRKGISSTVKVALVDPDNPSFRLFDWCRGEPPPGCTIGAWQTGGLMPDVRALHGTADTEGYIYVIGGTNDRQKPTNSVFFGTINGDGALYSPNGVYESPEIDFGQPATLKRINWQTTIGHEGKMTLSMQYRTSLDGKSWSAWSPEVMSQDGADNQIVPDPEPTGIRHMQYRANFATNVPNASPLLDRVEIYYDVRNPDLAVSKDTGNVITVPLGSILEYTIHYTNTGGWVAEGAVLTETLPAHTTYAGGSEWHQLGSSNVYSYRVGDLGRGKSGSATFQVQVADKVPPGTLYITNQVEINYPVMHDVWNQAVLDPNLDDNQKVLVSPLGIYSMTITKDAIPPPGSVVTPGSILTYSVRYSNLGTIRASQVLVTDTFGSLGSYTFITPTLPPTISEHVWDLGRLGPGRGGEITIVVQLADRLPNNWPITNQASLFSPEGDPFHSPVVTHTVMNYSGTKPAPMVDLTVYDIKTSPRAPWAEEPVRFYVPIANIGTLDADEPFWVELYIKPAPSEPPTWPYDHDQGYCVNGCPPGRDNYLWYPSQLPAGWATVLPFTGDDVLFPEPCTTYDVYVQIDVADVPNDDPYWGHYPEDNENNNIAQLSYTTPCNPRIFLPNVYRNSIPGRFRVYVPLVSRNSP